MTDEATTRLSFASPADFVAHLIPSDATWPTDPRAWLFRGQANAAWPLLPAALRDNAILDHVARPTARGPRATHREQVLAEHLLLKRFFERLDAARIAIPEDSQIHRDPVLSGWWNGYIEGVLNGKDLWPLHDVVSVMAVAQHYGLPTRLLDWTRSPFVAAYFAAVEAARWCAQEEEAPPEATHLCVWAFSAAALKTPTRENTNESPHVVTASSALIPNLALQQGVFSVHRRIQRADEAVAREPFDVLFRAVLNDNDARARTEEHPALVQLLLPIKGAPELLRRLAWHGVDASAVRAGHAGAAEAVHERRLWDIPDSIAPR